MQQAAEIPVTDRAWTRPPKVGDARVFRVSSGAVAEGVGLEAMAVFGIVASSGALGLPEICRFSPLPPEDTVGALRVLACRGLVEDVEDDSPVETARWRDFCLEVVAAASKARGKAKFSEIRYRFSRVPADEVRAAWEAAQARGLVPPDPGAPAPKRGKAARADETRPASGAKVFWRTARRFQQYRELLGEEGASYELPATEAGTRELLKVMAARIAERDPVALTLATKAQMLLVDRLVRELGPRHGFGHPAPDGRMTKTEASAFIDRWSKLAEATDKQVSYAHSIASALGLEVPVGEDGRYMRGEVGAFIAAHARAVEGLKGG